MEAASEIVNFEVDNEVNNEVIPATLDWSGLTGESKILPNHIEEKKKRGRPKKQSATGLNGKIIHKMDNCSAPVTKILSQETINLIHKEFNRFYKVHQMSLTGALHAICERHEIDYKQAYTMLKDEI